jgi:FemAB-related protein (PEP-CTERM system-associated)
MVVREFDRADAEAWDRFVRSHPEGTLFHLPQWKTAIERSFPHRTHYLLAERDGELAGVLPMARIKSLLFGDSLVSVPFAVYGGILARDHEAFDALEQAARGLAGRLGVGFLEMRNRAAAHEDWPRKDLYVTFRKELDPDPEANLKQIPRRQRAMVRRGIKAGLAVERDERTDRFYRMYAESVRNLGTPVFPRRFFETLREVFGEDCEVLTILNQGRPVASVMSFYFRDEVLPYYGGGTSEARAVAANDFMYWELMRRACLRGIRVFDYGRSKVDTGSYRFKKHWGFEPQPLHYECALVRASAIPEVNPLNPKYRLFIETWKRLPLGVANLIGPMIAKDLG